MKKILGILFGFLVFAPSLLNGQVLITGENGGKGSQAIMLSANALFPKDYTILTNFWAQYCLGLNSHVDAMVIYGNITAFGQTQHYVGVGSNIGLLKRKKVGADVSFYNNVTVPLNHTNDASTVLANFALVASRPVKICGLSFTPYGGFNVLAPIGKVRDKIFTPPETYNNAIVGVSFNLSKKWVAFFEYDPGTALRTSGMGALHLLGN